MLGPGFFLVVFVGVLLLMLVASLFVQRDNDRRWRELDEFRKSEDYRVISEALRRRTNPFLAGTPNEWLAAYIVREIYLEKKALLEEKERASK